MRQLAPSTSEGPFEDLPTEAAWFNRGCRATGADFTDEALRYLEAAGAGEERRGGKVAGIQIGAIVQGVNGRRFVVLAHGTLDPGARAGFKRSDTVKKAGFDAIMLRRQASLPVLMVTSHLPAAGACADYLAQLRPDVVDIVATEGDLAGFQRLRALFGTDTAGANRAPLAPSWQAPPGQAGLFDDAEHFHA
jgi:hypothetical protein